MNRTLVAAALACTALAGCYYPYGYYAAAPVQPAPVYADPAPVYYYPAPAYAPAWGGYWGPALSLNFGFGGGRGGWRHH
ncbi:hypothetical protein DN523_27975 [Burkholderia multivorans]|uniref:Lipoprotein n=2 Tax=Burkholderia multivorans TaxID=87883 RepID=A0A0H3KIC5_BURM1|nr:hypothetical protein [Burkholderia multivorans]ABX15768.1 conserved hypothetical protein [Burkholderia multivorans ATCC 17616]AIO77078.1 putative membrane protein [Burkholderia multivorans]AOK69053.1 hypothetical protein WM33_16455 [Burkholderia multivorans]AYY58567.1 hypothetical protein EGY20_17645 [Burkholderia multivorans]AYY98823.1 hypothetical protein EGY19_04800 [Burkholderia multivorans]